MSQVHVIKRTNTEVVLKCYTTNPSGSTIDIALDSNLITGSNEVYTSGKSLLSVKALYWGTKSGKHIDITRIVPTTDPGGGDTEWDPSGIHSHYYLMEAGSYEYKGFVDNVYSRFPIRMIGDGQFHCIMVLGKIGWKTKIEIDQFGAYDDPNQTGQ